MLSRRQWKRADVASEGILAPFFPEISGVQSRLLERDEMNSHNEPRAF